MSLLSLLPSPWIRMGCSEAVCETGDERTHLLRRQKARRVYIATQRAPSRAKRVSSHGALLSCDPMCDVNLH